MLARMKERESERGTVCLSVCAYLHASALKSRLQPLPLQINLSNCIRNSLFFFSHSLLLFFYLFRTAHRESQEQPQTRRHRNMSLVLRSPQLHVVHYSSLSLSLSLLQPLAMPGSSLCTLRSSLPLRQLLHISFYCHVRVHFAVS